MSSYAISVVEGVTRTPAISNSSITACAPLTLVFSSILIYVLLTNASLGSDTFTSTNAEAVVGLNECSISV